MTYTRGSTVSAEAMHANNRTSHDHTSKHHSSFTIHTSLHCVWDGTTKKVAHRHMVWMGYPPLAVHLTKHNYQGIIIDNHTHSLMPRQMDAIWQMTFSKCIFLNENVWIPIKISLKLVPKGPIINIPALVQIMAWRRPGDKPLSEPMVVSLPAHICVTLPQWVKTASYGITTNVFISAKWIETYTVRFCHKLYWL